MTIINKDRYVGSQQSNQSKTTAKTMDAITKDVCTRILGSNVGVIHHIATETIKEWRMDTVDHNEPPYIKR